MNRLLTRLLCHGLPLSLTACVSLATPKVAPELETLYGIQLAPQQLSIQVKSHGCSRAEHFKLLVSVSDHYPQLTVQRLGRDHCRRMPHVISLSLPMADIQGPFILANPLAVWRPPQRN